jgi:hypothetical protein
MGIKETLAARTKKRLWLAVLRPTNQEKVRECLSTLEARVNSGMSSEAFQQEINNVLDRSCIFVGFLKPGCKLLYDANGFPTGDSLHPGDVMDKIDDFKVALERGAYVFAQGKAMVADAAS